MTSLKRVFLFTVTNLAVVLVLGIVLRVLGVDQMLAARGVGVNTIGLLVFAAAFGFGGSLVSLALSKTIAKWSTRARVITTPQNEAEAWLYETVRQHAARAGIGMPEVAVYDAPEMNAFATGMFRNASLVAVSTGLLASMPRREVEAVLGHEIAHVANGDMITLALLQGVVNTFVIFISRLVGWVVDRVVLRNERGLGIGYWITVIAMEMVLGVLATMIVMWFSRRREFRADRGGADLAGRDSMISALAHLGAGRGPAQLPQSMKAFGIRGGSTGWLRLFSSHPPIEQRIAALQRAAR